MEIIATESGMRDKNAITAAKIALMSYTWMHTTGDVHTTAAEYDAINTTLNRLPPSFREYTRVMNLYITRVRAMEAVEGVHHPFRARYHYLQLHYVSELFVAPVSQQAILDLCNYESPVDIANHGDFAVDLLDANGWTAIWRAAPLRIKLRFYEFSARVDDRDAFVKANSHIYPVPSSS